WPARSTGTIAFVRSVTACAARAGSMLRSPSSTSTKTGVAPLCTITFTVAGQVIVVVITSSPGPTPSATRARCRAAVPEASASTCSASRYSAIRRSSSAARGPVVSQPERSVSATAAISSSPIAGGWKPSMVLRFVSDESFDIGLESNCRFRAGRPLERFVAALAHGQDRSRPVRAPAELQEAVARPAIDADAADAVLREGLFDARDLAQLALRRDQEAHAGAADARHGCKVRRRDVLAERGGECRAVQVDSERDAAELGVVPTAETRRELADARAVRSDEHLRVARPVLDSDRGRRGGSRLDAGADLGRLELARPGVRECDAESRQRRGQPVGHCQREEVSAGREGIHGHLAAGNVLLDKERRRSRRVERNTNGLGDVL